MIRKLFIYSLGMAFGLGSLSAQAPLPPEIENPEFLGQNKEPAHATLMPYANEAEALKALRHQSSLYRSLNGAWKFNWVPNPADRPVDFYKTDFDDSKWDKIQVPSCWQVLGYGTPIYRNAGYTFKIDWPHVMSEPPERFTAYKERNEVGSYRREFEVPATWQGRRTFISFDGVDSCFYLWVNGKKVGFSTNSRNLAEFDITSYIQPGKNQLAVEVYRYSAGSYLEDQDMWRLSGIFRNVSLWSSPETHIRDFFIKTDFDATYADATLQVSAKVKNYSAKPAAARDLTVTLHDAANKPVGTAQLKVPALAAGQEQQVELTLPVSKPMKWTAETPYLYTTVLKLGSGKDEELISAKTGFRKIEWKNRIFTVNGVPVKLKGVNRHEQWPDTGHTVSEDRMIRDLELIKQGNCNHVRTSHYTNDPRWYELCDEWGIYLVAEANVECHGLYNKLDRDPLAEKAIVDRNVANVETVKNHASVVIWSLGNECGGGSNFVAANKAVKALDGSRPTHYEPFGINKDNPADLDSQMYPSIAGVQQVATDTTRTKPYYLCEYAHAMFNSMGSIGDYNDVLDKYPTVIGGAIWEWQDQGLWNHRKDPAKPFLAYGGGFGDFPNNDFFIHKGVVSAERGLKPHYPEMKRVYQWISIKPGDLAQGQVQIRNRYAFLNLNGFVGHWSITEDGTEVAKGDLGKLNVAPGEEITASIPVGKIQPKAGASYQLRVFFTLASNQIWAKAGYEIAAQQIELPIKSAAPVGTISGEALKLTDGEKEIQITGKGFEVVFDKTTGLISQLKRDGVELLVPGKGPQLQLWRAPHRNDDMWAWKEWQAYGLNKLTWTTRSVTASQTPAGAVRIVADLLGIGSNRFQVSHNVAYTIYPDGSIAVDNAVNPSRNKIPLAHLGVRLELKKPFTDFSYLGRGPMENYADRKRGSDFGLYTSSVQKEFTPYSKPMECGNHEDVKWAALTGAKQPVLMAQAEGQDLQVAALPYSDDVMHPVAYSVDLPESTSTVMTISVHTLGVGSAGCGPRPLPQYVPLSAPESFSYILRLLPAGQKDLAAIARSTVPQDRVKPELKPTALKPAPKGTVIEASSFEPGEGDAAHAVDGDPATYWHSKWKEGNLQPPHHLILDYGKSYKISGLMYTARTDSANGHVRDYEVYVSEDGKTWGEPSKKGKVSRDASYDIINFDKPVSGRYVKFVVLTEQDGKPFASIAELELMEAE
jgi:beta-galactosidase